MQRREFLAAKLSLFLASTIECAFGSPAEAPPGRIGPVGVRTNFGQGWSDPQLRWMTTRLAHAMPYDANDIQLVYENSSRGEKTIEAPGRNRITISAAIEFPEGVLHTASFDSRSQATALPGQSVVSDPISISLPGGAAYYTRTTVIVHDAPYAWPYTRVSSPGCGDWTVAGSDPDMISGDPPAQRRPSKAFGPCNILGKTTRAQVAVAVLGDSVVAGEPGEGDRAGNRGFIERALAAKLPWCNLAESGDSLAAFLVSHERRLQLLRQNFTHVICALGIGDVRGGDEAAIRARFLQVWQLLSDLGLKVFQTTITTHTASTDKWATAEGQSIVNPNFLPDGLRHRINEWIRSSPSPLAGYFDPSALLETERDSGIWSSPNHLPVTDDGPHLNALGAELAASCIDTGKFKL